MGSKISGALAILFQEAKVELLESQRKSAEVLSQSIDLKVTRALEEMRGLHRDEADTIGDDFSLSTLHHSFRHVAKIKHNCLLPKTEDGAHIDFSPWHNFYAVRSGLGFPTAYYV